MIRVHLRRARRPHLLFMRELSVFVDESGDFGEYDFHSPYYILSFVFHDQNVDINNELNYLDKKLNDLGLKDHAVHTGPIIRQEKEYFDVDFQTRQKILKTLMAFFRSIDIKCKTLYVEKKHKVDEIELVGDLSKQLSRFIKDNLDFFQLFDSVKIYYDNGQIPVTKILSSVFSITLNNVQFKRAVKPSRYRLFQIADMICTMELIRLKMDDRILSKSELHFFGEPRIIKKKYLKIIDDKRML